MLKGIMCSGKTTFAKQFIKDNPTYKCVNKSVLRHMISNYTYNKENEELVFKLWESLVEGILCSGYNLIVDDANLDPAIYERKISIINAIATKHNIQVTYKLKEFDISLEEAILRDKKRPDPVGEDVIRRTYKKFIFSHKRASIMGTAIQNTNETKLFYSSRPSCIIYDLDGTMALNSGHRPYYKYGDLILQDKVNSLLLYIIKGMKISSNISCIAVTGRSEEDIEYTRQWIGTHDIPCDWLFMRSQGDNRPDDIIKKEIYDTHIRDNFNVLCVFDDRPKVLDMWIQQGLYTFNVNQDPYCKIGF